MSWIKEAHPELIPQGTKVRVSSGDNVIVGKVHTVGTRWITLDVVGLGEPIELLHADWEVATERTTFWDVMERSELGTIAVKERVDKLYLMYHKTQAGVVNSETLNRVGAASSLADENASNFEWYQPSVFTP